MGTRLTLTAMLLATCMAVGTGCDNKPQPAPPSAPVALPEVNNDNCKSENIAKLDPAVRQPFADACFRSGTYKPSSGKTW